MKSKWFALAILLIVPAVATPETKIDSCDARMLVYPGRVLDGVKIERDIVEFLSSLLRQTGVDRAARRILSRPDAQIKSNAAQILQNAGEINVTLTTKLSERTAGE